MKRNVVYEYIRNAIKISTDEHVFKTLTKVKRTLRRSNYPEHFYKTFMLESITNLGKLQDVGLVGNPEAIDFRTELSIRHFGNGEFHKAITGMNKTFKTLKNRKSGVKKRPKGNSRFVSIPFHEAIFRRTKKMIQKNNVNITLAPRSALKNGHFTFSNVMDEKDIFNVKHGFFSVRCMDC